MHTPRVLVVDDEFEQRRVFCRLLNGQGFQAVGAPSALHAAALVRSFCPDFALIDIGLPRISGIKLLEIFRAAPETKWMPVILMTGLAVPREMVAAAGKGIGDGEIFVKGGDLFGLVARIRAALNAGVQAGSGSSRCLRRGALEADPEEHWASYAGVRIHLHARSLFDLLCALMRSDEPLDCDALRGLLWNDSETAGVVYVAVNRLRTALKRFPNIRIEATPRGYLLTVKETEMDAAPAQSDS
ncbi:MAG TPA: response regulator transcription factor [Elusimicrobiota bacterium]|jgi:two-component system phosphate regulon response regulator PhoB|nr:response regulator transcription factor [Elusimicrobiota bacterium]